MGKITSDAKSYFRMNRFRQDLIRRDLIRLFEVNSGFVYERKDAFGLIEEYLANHMNWKFSQACLDAIRADKSFEEVLRSLDCFYEFELAYLDDLFWNGDQLRGLPWAEEFSSRVKELAKYHSWKRDTNVLNIPGIYGDVTYQAYFLVVSGKSYYDALTAIAKDDLLLQEDIEDVLKDWVHGNTIAENLKGTDLEGWHSNLMVRAERVNAVPAALKKSVEFVTEINKDSYLRRRTDILG